MRMPRVFYDIFCTNTWIDIDLCKACIRCTLAKNQKEVDAAIKSLKSNSKNSKRVIGLSLVSTPTIQKPAYVLLCDGSQCVIVDLSSFNVIPKSLFEFFSFPSFTFVGYEMMATIAPGLEKYGLVCNNDVLEAAGPSFQKTVSMLLSLRPRDRDVSGVFRTKGVKLSVISISEAYAAFCVGNIIQRDVHYLKSSSFLKTKLLCLRW